MTRDDVMAIAWRDFIEFAAGEPAMIAAFNAATGRSFMQNQPRTILDAMIDEATGKARDDAAAFVRWVTINHWGLDMAPQAYRAAIESEMMKESPDAR